MPTVEFNSQDLLALVKQMAPDEFDTFLEKALAARPRAATLSPGETKLIKRINRGLPPELSTRYAQLIEQRKKGSLTVEDHEELLKLTHQAETRDAERAADLLELAKLRRVPVRVLMKQLGIETPAIHG